MILCNPPSSPVLVKAPPPFYIGGDSLSFSLTSTQTHSRHPISSTRALRPQVEYTSFRDQSTMWFSADKATWKLKAEAKASATLEKIAKEWRLPKVELDKAAEQRDITGPFIQQYPEPSELDIIRE
jgi:hypothetical protein